MDGQLVIGVDAGGTRTRAVVVDAQGDCHGFAVAGPGNPNSAGADLARESITAACSQALAGCQVAARPALIVITMAGGSATGGRIDGLEAQLATAGITAPVALRGDQLGAYFSGTWQPDGGVLIAGTGAVGGIIAGGEIAEVIDGCGWLVGDDGSGFWVGRRVVHDVLAAIDGRGPATALTQALLACLPEVVAQQGVPGDPRRAALVRHSYGLRPVELSQYAPLAFELADRDRVAAAIVAEAADRLAATAAVICDRLPDQAPVVLAGSVATGGSAVTARLADQVGPRVRLSADGTVGAATLALSLAGCGVDEAIWHRMHEQVSAAKLAAG